jgi:5'-AMP-activated protein kinase regulatory beta subunit
VTFRFEAPDVHEVILMGDFNGWNPKKHPMKHNKDGIWEKTAILPPGNYEYKFLVDGNWQMDPESNHVRMNCYGTYNNLLTIKPKK